MLYFDIMEIDEEVMEAQDLWAKKVLDKIFTEEENDEKVRIFVDCFFGCSGSCESCEGTTHCGNTYDD